MTTFKKFILSTSRRNRPFHGYSRTSISRCLMAILVMIVLQTIDSFGASNAQKVSYHGYANQQNTCSQGSQGANIGMEKLCNPQKYKPEGPVGIRYKKQILQARDTKSGTFDSHMLESAIKRKHFLSMFSLEDQSSYEDDFQLQQLCFSSLEPTMAEYAPSGKDSSKAFCFDRSESSKDQLIPPNTFMSSQFYKPKNPIESKGIDRNDHYLNMAQGVKSTYELPIQALEYLDYEQTIEGFLFKKSKQNNIDNYYNLSQVLTNQQFSSIEIFSSQSFTYEEPGYIQNLTNGLRPIQIQNLKPMSSIYRYFTSEIEITPQKISFDECQLLIPKFETIKISNKQRSHDVKIKAIIGSSPELSFYFPEGISFPLTLRPMSSIEIQVAYTPETLGLFESILYLAIDERVYISSLNAYVVPNLYDIQPFYITDLNVNQSLEIPLYIYNPSTTDTLIIEELYSTDKDLKLNWPHSSHAVSDKLNDSSECTSFIQHILVPEESRKLIANMVFEIDRTLDFIVDVIIRTSLNDIIRVPLYYHVHEDIIKFTPIDFGIAPLNFDQLKLPLFARSKLSEDILIQEILVPLGDSRLDFQMVDIDDSTVVKKNKDIFLGYILMNPSHSGLVESKIVVTCKGVRSNKVYSLDIPIIGSVLRNSNVLGAEIVSNSQDESLNYPVPLVQFDVSEYQLESSQNRSATEIPKFKEAILQSTLIIKNTFNVPIKLRGIVNLNPEIRVVNTNSDTNYNLLSNNVILQPGQSIKYASVQLLTSMLKVSQGNKYISVIANNTLIPIAIAIYDGGILCLWDDQKTIGIPFCNSEHQMNFDYVAINDQKAQRLKITNPNPVNLTFKSISKESPDEIFKIQIEKNEDSKGNKIDFKKTKNNFAQVTIRPYQTMHVKFEVSPSEKKQKFSRINFKFIDERANFQARYYYNAISGNITLVPQSITFGPSYPGIVQSKAISARSTFPVPIQVLYIVSNDIRFFPAIKQNANIHPNASKLEIGSVTFDPSKQQISLPTFSYQQNFKMGDVDISSIFSQAFSNIEPGLQQNLMNIVQGWTNGQPIGQQQQVTMIQLSKNQVMQPILTPQDLESYREKQKIWDDQDSLIKGEISSSLTIVTNVQNTTLNVKGQLQKPSIIDQHLTGKESENGQSYASIWAEAIDFETVQVGTSQSRSVKIVNPSDEPLLVVLFITTNEIFNQLSKNNSYGNSNQQSAPVQSDRDYFFQLYCSQKLLELKNRTLKANNFSNFKLSQKEDQKIVCKKAQMLLQQVSNSSSAESDTFRHQLETYFKEVYMADIKKDIEAQQNIAQLQQQTLNMLKLNQNNPAVSAQTKSIKSSLEQAMQQSIHNGGLIGNLMHHNQLPTANKKLETISNAIAKHSISKPVDQNTISIFKANYEKQKLSSSDSTSKGNFITRNLPEYQTVVDTTLNILKALIFDRPPLPKTISNMTAQAKAEKLKKDAKEKLKEEKGSSFKLKNQILNNIIINNDTTEVFGDKIKDADPQTVTYTGQSFFINPKYQGHVFKVDPRSNFTINDAIIFQPQSLSTTQMEMKLVLKNNLTVIDSVDVRGYGGTGILEVVKVLKRAPGINGQTSDHYVNAQQHTGYQFGSADISDYTNLSINSQSQQIVRERIVHNIYGIKEKDDFYSQGGHQKDVILRTNYRQGLPGFLSLHGEYDSNTMQFQITYDDIFVSHTESSVEETSSDYQAQQSSNQLKVQKSHKRVLVVQNTGNLPLNIEELSIDNKGCSAQNFVIENCHGFTLKPGDQFWIHIVYTTDFTIAKLKKRLTLESKQGVIQEFQIEVTLPVEFLQLANELLPLTQFEEWQLLIVKFAILTVAFTTIALVAKDVLSHIRFTKHLIPSHEDILQIIEDVIPMSTKAIPPVLKEYIPNDQVYQLFQQASDKLSGGGRNQSQVLLLKEVTNLCSNKRNLVCLEAQKQAYDAEKEQRRAQHMRTIGYAQQQYLNMKQREQQQQQLQKPTQEAVHEYPSQRVASEMIQPSQKQNKQMAYNEMKIGIVQGQKQQDQNLIGDMNESSTPQVSNEHLTEESKVQPSAESKTAKMSKKQKRDLEKRIKEQLEAKENFIKQQEEKEKLDILRRAEEAKQEQLRQERFRKMEIQAQLDLQKLQQMKQADESIIEFNEEQSQRKSSQMQQDSSAPQSVNQSMIMYERENCSPLSLSINQANSQNLQSLKSENQKVEGDTDNKDIDLLDRFEGELSERNSMYSQQRPHQLKMKKGSEYSSNKRKSVKASIEKSNEKINTLQSSFEEGDLSTEQIKQEMPQIQQKHQTLIHGIKSKPIPVKIVDSQQVELGFRTYSQSQDYQAPFKRGAPQRQPYIEPRRIQGQGYYDNTPYQGRGGQHYSKQRPEQYQQFWNNAEDTYFSHENRFSYENEDEDRLRGQSNIFEVGKNEMARQPESFIIKEEYDDIYQKQRFAFSRPQDQVIQNDPQVKELKQQLSNDDLKEYFEQRKVIEVNLAQDKALGALLKKENIDALKGQTSGASIFSDNLLSNFSQTPNDPSASKSSEIKQRQPEAVGAYLGQQNVEFNSQLKSQEENKESDDEDEQWDILNNAKDEGDSQRSSSDLYNVFKSASSLFSRPLFGSTTTSKYQQQKQQQQAFPQTNQPSIRVPLIQPPTTDELEHQQQSIFSNRYDEDVKQEQEEDDQEEETLGGGSLFSGSLFGEQSIFVGGFGGAKEQLAQPNTWKNQENEQLLHQNQSALRRNQQSLWEQQHPVSNTQPSIPTGQRIIHHSMQGMVPPPPPPGLGGYRPQHSLYAQYSQGITYGEGNVPYGGWPQYGSFGRGSSGYTQRQYSEQPKWDESANMSQSQLIELQRKYRNAQNQHKSQEE